MIKIYLHLSIAPVGYVLVEDFEEEVKHPATTAVGIYVGGRAIDQIATELHSVSVSFATGVVSEAADESHVILEFSLQNIEGVTPISAIKARKRILPT